MEVRFSKAEASFGFFLLLSLSPCVRASGTRVKTIGPFIFEAIVAIV